MTPSASGGGVVSEIRVKSLPSNKGEDEDERVAGEGGSHRVL